LIRRNLEVAVIHDAARLRVLGLRTDTQLVREALGAAVIDPEVDDVADRHHVVGIVLGIIADEAVAPVGDENGRFLTRIGADEIHATRDEDGVPTALMHLVDGSLKVIG